MLSFMREKDESEKFPGSTQDQQIDGQQKQESFDENAEGADYLTTSVGEGNMKRSTILMVLVFGAGIAGLYFMIKKSSPKSVSAAPTAEDVQLEQAITDLTGVKTEVYVKMDEIVKKFYEFSDVKQVTVNDLSRNPFRWSYASLGSSGENIGNQRTDKMMAQIRFEAMVSGLTVDSIIQTADGKDFCMINGQCLYVGDEIEGIKIIAINPDSVTLECNGMQHNIQMSLP